MAAVDSYDPGRRVTMPADPGPQGPPPIALVSAADLVALTGAEPDWLVGDLVPARSVVVLAGQPGIGKSFAALSWAACVAGGQDWFGRPTKAGGVVYVLGEGFGSFGRRVAAWQSGHGPVSDRLAFLDGTAAGVDLADPESVDLLIETVRGHDPELLILDTFSTLAHVQSENDNAEVARAMRGAHRVVQALGCSVILVHHVSKEAGKVRGATAFRGNADAVIVAAHDPGSSRGDFFLSTRGTDDGKQRDGEAVWLPGFCVAAPGVLTRPEEAAAHAQAVEGLEALMAGPLPPRLSNEEASAWTAAVEREPAG